MSLRYQGAWLQTGAFDPLASPPQQFTYFLYGWGTGSDGILGLGNTTSYSSPKQIGSLSNWLYASGGDQHTLAIKTDGTLWAWGRNSTFGALGLGNRTNYSSPKQVGSLTNWASIAPGQYSSFAIKTDGTLWSWGQNNIGQLGLNSQTYAYSSPKQVGSLSNWKQITGGSSFAAAIKTDGTLWSWGANNAGQLGLGNTTAYSSPKQVGSLTNWSSVFAFSGGSFCVALKTDGTLWSWGANNAGQLGLGTVAVYSVGNVSSPSQVGALSNWVKVACGERHVVAVKTDGTLWSWGGNGSGQLGLGNTTYYSSPKQVGSLTVWSTGANGSRYSMAIRTNNTLWAWGRNDQGGQLGLGDTTARSSPTQVGALTSWGNVGCGTSHTFGLLI